MTINRVAALLNAKCDCLSCAASREFTAAVHKIRELESATEPFRWIDWHLPSPERIAAGDRSAYVTLFCSLGLGTIDADFRTATIDKFREVAGLLLTIADDLQSRTN